MKACAFSTNTISARRRQAAGIRVNGRLAVVNAPDTLQCAAPARIFDAAFGPDRFFNANRFFNAILGYA